MSKEYKNIDDLFRSELGGSETAAPTFVKPKIDSALGFGNRKKRFFWIGLIAVVFASSTILLVDLQNSTEEKHISQSLIDGETMTQDQEFNQELIFQSNENNRNLDSIYTATAISVSPTNETDLKIGSQAERDPNSTNTAPLTVGAGTEKTDPPNASSAPKKDPNVETGLNDKSGSKIPVKKGAQEKRDTTDLSHDPKPMEETGIAEEGIAPVLIVEKRDSIDQDREDQSAEIADNTSPSNDSTNQTPEIAPEIDLTFPPKDDFKPWMIHLTGGPNFVRSSYTAKNQNDKTIYTNATSDLIGSQMNLDLMYGLRKGLSFGSGIGLTNYAENFTFQTKFISIDTTKNIEYIYEDTSEVIIDSVITYTYTENINTAEHNGLNKASYVHVPLHVGAQLIFGRLQVDIYSSIRFNFLTRSKGGYLAQSQFVEFGKENSIFKPFFVDLMFSSRINYRVYKSLYATGSVQYRPVLGSVYTTSNFNKSFDYVHLGLGLSYRF